MRKGLCSSTLVLILACCAWAADDKKKDDPKADPKKITKDDPKADPDKKETKDDLTPSPDKKDKKEKKPKKVDDGFVSAGEVLGIYRNQGSSAKGITIGVESVELQFSGGRFKPAKVMKDISLQPTDNMKVRIANPPVVHDEKGRIKRYTSKELKELKGDSSLPGYQADQDNLHNDQLVKLYLVQKKDQPKAKRVKGKDAPLDENLPQIRMIVILTEVQD